MNPIELIEKRISFWDRERSAMKKRYGQFSRMVDRTNSMIGSLRLLRDEIRETTITKSKETLLAITNDPVFILLPFYWDRCSEIKNTIEEMFAKRQDPSIHNCIS